MAWLQFDDSELINLDNILTIGLNDPIEGSKTHYICFITSNFECYKTKIYKSKKRAMEVIDKLKIEIIKGTPLIDLNKL